jgi:hypothetical protein
VSDHDRSEVVSITKALLENLRVPAERNPEAIRQSDDFNRLLARVQAAFPESAAIQDLRPAHGPMTLADLVGKLAMISGAATNAHRPEIEIGIVPLRDRFPTF